jgi:photosystem II stability/assembly factor-like uncharacterized protein
MRDLDSELTGLRNTLQDSIDQPATKDMIKRGRRRVRRQQAQVAAVVTLIVAAGALPFLQMPQWTAPATPERSHVVSQDYYDTRAGFVLGETCVRDDKCESWFVTTSNGDTWEKRTVPLIAAGSSSKVIALGTSKVVIDNHPTDRYYSNDGGRSWTAIPVHADTTIQQIPDDAALETTTLKSAGSQCRDSAVIAVLSDSGRSAKLATQPPILLTWCQPYPDLNGTRWVAGSDPRTRQPVVASTRDYGRTWQVTPLPAFTPPPAGRVGSDYPEVTVVSTPAASYATVINPGDGELVAMFRSGDYGATWTQAWQAQEGKLPARTLGSPVAGTDGSISIPQPGNAWVSTDGAKNFISPAGPSKIPVNGTMRWLRAGYLSSSRDSASTGQFSLSYDGLKWYPVQIPMPE